MKIRKVKQDAWCRGCNKKIKRLSDIISERDSYSNIIMCMECAEKVVEVMKVRKFRQDVLGLNVDGTEKEPNGL